MSHRSTGAPITTRTTTSISTNVRGPCTSFAMNTFSISRSPWSLRCRKPGTRLTSSASRQMLSIGSGSTQRPRGRTSATTTATLLNRSVSKVASFTARTNPNGSENFGCVPASRPTPCCSRVSEPQAEAGGQSSTYKYQVKTDSQVTARLRCSPIPALPHCHIW